MKEIKEGIFENMAESYVKEYRNKLKENLSIAVLKDIVADLKERIIKQKVVITLLAITNVITISLLII